MSTEDAPSTCAAQSPPVAVASGPRTILRPKSASDAANDYAWRRDPELSRFDAVAPLSMPFETFRADFLTELRNESPHRRRYAVETREGLHIGNCSIYNIDLRRKEAELGIMIGDKRYWDHGYGTEIVTVLVRHAFDTLPIERIYLYSLEWNLRAQRAFAKVGFVERRRTREIGHNFVVMDITRAQLAARQENTPA
jgi:ribosomal-protein-alanine N-acetyltransferase